MGLSKVRANIPDYDDRDLKHPAEGDMKAWEVFVQTERGKPHTHCGSVDAADAQMALQFAREHYGRDQRCVQVWVVPREAIARTDYDKDVVFRLTDQGYRMAWGYNVGAKWRALRKAKDVEEYEKEDLKEHF
jgi:ring-1,2-phenylacetyl-CoA epoxidase subunit PaaB